MIFTLNPDLRKPLAVSNRPSSRQRSIASRDKDRPISSSRKEDRKSILQVPLNLVSHAYLCIRRCKMFLFNSIVQLLRFTPSNLSNSAWHRVASSCTAAILLLFYPLPTNTACIATQYLAFNTNANFN